MLPLQEGIRKRLSQLQVMAICKAFIGKNNFFQKIAAMPCSSSEENQLSFEFSQALPGFLLMASTDGKFLYLSDNVMEILGHSMVDFVTQSETIFDLFDERGQAQVMKLLSGVQGSGEDFVSGSASGECSLDEISFTCLMGLSKNVRRHPGLDRQKVMKVSARLVKPVNYLNGGEPVLVAFCCPWSPVMPTGDLVPTFSTTVCQTRHSMDMKFLDIDANGQFHLGYSDNELQLQSWYKFIHPDDEAEFASRHLEVISNGPDSVSSTFIRVQTKYGHFIWLHIVMRMLPGSEFSTGQSEIACISHVLDDEEVAFRKEREQLEAEMGDYASNAHIFKNQGSEMYQVPTAYVDDRFLGTSVSYMSQPDMWSDNETRGKRKSTGDEAYGRPRKMRTFTASEDSASSASSSSMMFSSPASLDVDQMETCLNHDLFQADFNLKLEDPFQPKPVSPYSMLSDSIGSSSSPRMYPEDDGSFFRSMSASPTQKNVFGEVSDLSLLNGGSYPINDLTTLKSLVPEAIMLASPKQEVPKELPELDLTDLNDYLKTVEDEKKVLTNMADLSYAEYLPPAYEWNHRVLQQNQTQRHPEKCTTLTYEPRPVQGGEFCYEKPTAVNFSRSNNGSAQPQFSSVAFLESLIESPQFTELIGMMASGPQKQHGFQEQGVSCFG